MVSSFNLKHNKYTSTPDWFKDSKSNGDSVAGSGTNYGGAVIGSTYNTVDYSEIPIDNSTIVWQDEKLAVPIDNSTIIINDEKLSVPIDNDTIIIKDGKLVVSFDENDLLDNYVTVKGDLDIEGVKNFKPGVLIDGVRVTKPQDDVIYIDGNLAVKGGITMYADDGNVDVSSIYDGLPIDKETLVWGEDVDGNKVLKANSGTIKKIETDGKGNAITSVTLGDDNSTLLFHKNGEFAYQSQVDIISDNLDELDTEFHEFKDYAETYYVTVHTEQEIYGKKDFTTGGLFVNGNQIIYNKDDDYWMLKGDLLITGGITTYVNDGTAAPSLFEALPIDQQTILRNEAGALMINPNLEFGLNEEELISFLEANKYATQSWVYGLKYASASALTNLSDVVATKWTQDDIKIGNWDTAYKWGDHSKVGYALKSYVDDTFVTLATEQAIRAHKDFLNGLSIGGLGITKSQDDVIYLDANLVVRGGITMYATDAIDVPSIIEALPPASYSDKGIASFNPNDFSVVDGYVSFIGKGGVDESALADYAKKTDLSAYLPLSGGQMTGDIGYSIGKGSYDVGIPSAGTIEAGLVVNASGFKNLKTFIGTYHDSSNWMNIISVRHRNGYGDGDGYGMYIVSKLTSRSADLVWNRQFNPTEWQGDRVILDSVNWSQYVTAADWGNYLPLSGGALGGSLGFNNTDGQGMGISLYGGTGSVQKYGIWFGVTSAWGTHGVMTGDWATYFGMDGDSSRGWVFRHFANGNVASITGNGDICANSWFRSQGDCGWYNGRYGGGLWMCDSELIRTFGGKILYIEEGGLAATNTYGIGGHTLHLLIGGSGAPHSSILLRSDTCGWGIASNTNGNMYIGRRPSNKHNVYINDSYILELSLSGLLCYGGITMYSDIRKKTKLQDVELTLKQIADAPLIEHYYNSDEKRTTHVGSIAQYWASMNDWFCKLDNDGFYTMEIQNAALASAISIARELVKYESKTDRKIRLLKQRVKELEDKIEKLENN